MCWLVLQERTERERESVVGECGRSVSKLFFVTGFFGITDVYELTSEQRKAAAVKLTQRHMSPVLHDSEPKLHNIFIR